MPKTANITSTDTQDSVSSDEQDGAEVPTHDQIAARAYSLWEKGGRKQGTAAQDWEKAEQELTGS